MNYVVCSKCGKRVSNTVKGDIIIRAFVECPDCIEKEEKESTPMNHKTSECCEKCYWTDIGNDKSMPICNNHDCPCHQTLSTVLEEVGSDIEKLAPRVESLTIHDKDVSKIAQDILDAFWVAQKPMIVQHTLKSSRTVIEKVVEMVDEDIELAKERVAFEEKIMEKTIGNPNTFEKGRLSVLSDLQAELRESIK